MRTTIGRGHHVRPHRRPPVAPGRFGDLTRRPGEVNGEGNQVANVRGEGNVVNSPTIVINNGDIGDNLAYNCGNEIAANDRNDSSIVSGALGFIMGIASMLPFQLGQNDSLTDPDQYKNILNYTC